MLDLNESNAKTVVDLPEGSPAVDPLDGVFDNVASKEVLSNVATSCAVAEPTAITPPYIVGEATELRTESVKHFRRSDGSYLACDYGGPVHTKSPKGEWQDLDLRLVKGERGYHPAVSSQDFCLPEALDSTQKVTITHERYPLSWRYELVEKALDVAANQITSSTQAPTDSLASRSGANLAAGSGVSPTARRLNLKPKERSQAPLSGDARFTTLERLADLATYPEVSSGVDLEYQSLPTGLKENIVLKDATAPTNFLVRYEVGELTPRVVDGQAVELIDDRYLPQFLRQFVYLHSQ